jgi:hypothetical protein
MIILQLSHGSVNYQPRHYQKFVCSANKKSYIAYIKSFYVSNIDLLIEKYLNNPDETESIDKIKSLLDNYTIENKKELIEITRLNYIVNMNSQAIT